jgi:DNA-binding response OmpR family regulator
LPLATELHEALDGNALERALTESGPYQLVVASARLPEPSALQVLARVRRAGIRTPFIVVASLSTHERRMRVFVSDAEGTVLSSRVLDDENLAVLVTRLIEDGAAPA